MMSSGREGAASLIVKMEDRIVTRLSGGNLQHDYVMAVFNGGIHKGGKRHWWLRMETSTPSCSWTFWKTSAFHTNEELMDTTFGCKATTFAHIWLLQ